MNEILRTLTQGGYLREYVLLMSSYKSTTNNKPKKNQVGTHQIVIYDKLNIQENTINFLHDAKSKKPQALEVSLEN